MVLIISSQEDQSTNEVIDWMLALRQPFVRINEWDELEIIRVDQAGDHVNFELLLHKEDGTQQLISSAEITSFWYRRGGYTFKSSSLQQLHHAGVLPEVNRMLLREGNTAGDFICHLLESGNGFGSPVHNHTNKLTNLTIAASCGLKVPRSYLIRTKKELISLLDQMSGQVLVKGIHQLAMHVAYNGRYLTNMSSLLQTEHLAEVAEVFPLSLVQEYIEKKQDLRVFYLDGAIFGAAIFSQRDAQTRIDFRNYNFQKPNRMVPFKFPERVEKQIRALMVKLRMKSGSLDILYTPQKEFVFLEVNPVGQFGMVSHPCNYQLERLIAQKLSA